MSDKLHKFIEQVEKLPDGEQSMLADYLQQHLADVLDEAKWEASFHRSEKLLQLMGQDVDESIRNGDISRLNPDEL